MGDSMRIIVRNLCGTFPLLLALFVLLAWGGRDVVFTGTPDPAADRAVMMDQWVQDSLDAQLADLGCDKTPRLAPNVAVRPAQASPAERAHGHWVFDTAVVTVVPFDEAFAQAEAGTVWVIGWCG
jgi:hypothetical protein